MATYAVPANTIAIPSRPSRLIGFMRYVRRNPSLGVGLGMLLFLLLFSTVGTLFVDIKRGPYPLGAPASKPPSLKYPLGTDAQGRNLLPTMMIGTQYTLRIGLLAGTIGIVVGTILGFLAAFYGGILDTIIKWIVDVMLTIPQFLVLIVIASTLKSYITIENTALIIASLSWIGPARTIRAQVLSMRERPFVMMARLSGMNGPEIIFRELIPNLMPFLLASFVGAVTAAIYTSLGLALLGLASQRDPTLGMTIYWVQKYSAILRGLWWWWVIPVVIILMLVIGLALTSLGLDEWANPRTRRAA